MRIEEGKIRSNLEAEDTARFTVFYDTEYDTGDGSFCLVTVLADPILARKSVHEYDNAIGF